MVQSPVPGSTSGRTALLKSTTPPLIVPTRLPWQSPGVTVVSAKTPFTVKLPPPCVILCGTLGNCTVEQNPPLPASDNEVTWVDVAGVEPSRPAVAVQTSRGPVPFCTV